MTLTRMIPSLRATLPDPLVPDLWPEATRSTVTDVVVGGISLLRLAEVYGTPCGFTGASVIPHTDGRPSATRETSVRVVRITQMVTRPSGEVEVETDGALDPETVTLPELRLIGRASTAHVVTVQLAAHSRSVELPGDLRVGDLLAAPSHPVEMTWAQRLHERVGRVGIAEECSSNLADREFAHQPAWLSALE